MSQGDRNSPRELGAALQRARAAAGVSLETITERTKIPARTLQALEAGELGKLPSKTFARMFLRQIVGILGEPEERWLRMLDEAWERSVEGGEPPRVQITATQRRRRVGPWIIGLLLVGAGLAALFVLAGRQPLVGPEGSSLPPATLLPLLVPTPTPPAEPSAAAPTPEATPADPGVLVVVTGSHECWVEAHVVGSGTHSHLVPAGTVWTVPAGGAEVRLKLGNAGAIDRVHYLGRVHEQLGKEGEVVRLTLGTSVPEGAR